MNYLKAIKVVESRIVLSDRIVVAKRLPLLQHTMLIELHKNITSEDDKVKLNSIFQYIKLAANIDYPEFLNVEDIPALLDSLIKLNEDIELFPWQVTYRVGSSKTTNADYENRELAMTINILAGSYGWSEDVILQLQPEIAACYVQEVLLDEWKRQEFEYRLSEVAYDEKGIYIPFPKLDWLVEIVGPSAEKAKGKIPKRFVPDGVIIDGSIRKPKQEN